MQDVEMTTEIFKLTRELMSPNPWSCASSWANLLRSARLSLDVLLKHLDRIESSSTFRTDAGLYLVSPEAKVVDIIRANYLENWRDVDAG